VGLVSVIDALVVGAGPAGSIAALQLARAGVSVRLVDREMFPRHKLCGDTLNPGSLALLERLGIAEKIRKGARRTTGMLVTGPAGAAVGADYPRDLYGLTLTRSDLDTILVEAAVAAGADFEPGVTVTGPLCGDGERRVDGVRLGGGRRSQLLRARIVIAADGRGSRLASALGIARFAAAPKRWAYGAYFADVHGLTTRGEMHIRREGYLGIAPLPNALANVCVVKALRSVASRDGDRASVAPDRVIADAIAADPALRGRFQYARRVSEVSVLGPLAVVASATGCAGLLLAGDAAGFVDPMTGDGMRFALRGGELAASAALRELESGRPAHASLAAERAREFSAKWRINRVLRALVGSPRALAAAAVVAGRWAAPVEYLIAVAGDVSLATALGGRHAT
jgi:flavin-dependent dehydrogenase